MEARIRELMDLEPRLAELEAEIDGIQDDGHSSWFCSNFMWLPLNSRLRLLIGVARKPRLGHEDAAELYESNAYECMFEHLSRRMPPCRACGCRAFLALARSVL